MKLQRLSELKIRKAGYLVSDQTNKQGSLFFPFRQSTVTSVGRVSGYVDGLPWPMNKTWNTGHHQKMKKPMRYESPEKANSEHDGSPSSRPRVKLTCICVSIRQWMSCSVRRALDHTHSNCVLLCQRREPPTTDSSSMSTKKRATTRSSPNLLVNEHSFAIGWVLIREKTVMNGARFSIKSWPTYVNGKFSRKRIVLVLSFYFIVMITSACVQTKRSRVCVFVLSTAT